MNLRQFVLEYATPRAGSVEALKGLSGNVLIGLGAVNPRTAEVESPQQIVQRVEELVKVVGANRVYLNPDCGFGTFADRPVATAKVAFEKLCALSQAATILRRRHE